MDAAWDGTQYLVGARDMTAQLGNDAVTEACSTVAPDAAVQEELRATIEEMTRERCIVTGRA